MKNKNFPRKLERWESQNGAFTFGLFFSQDMIWLKALLLRLSTNLSIFTRNTACIRVQTNLLKCNKQPGGEGLQENRRASYSSCKKTYWSLDGFALSNDTKFKRSSFNLKTNGRLRNLCLDATYQIKYPF